MSEELYTTLRAGLVISEGTAPCAFGVLFLANPDLPVRFWRGASFNEPDPSTFYAVGPKGYIDYPFLEDATA